MNSAFIRNCNFLLKCPAYWDELGPTDQESVRYCGACERMVFMCNTQDELRVRIDQNDCVAVRLPEHPMRLNYDGPTLGVPSREQDRKDRAAQYTHPPALDEQERSRCSSGAKVKAFLMPGRR